MVWTVGAIVAILETLATAMIRTYDFLQQIKGDQEIPTLRQIIDKSAKEIEDIQANADEIEGWLDSHPK